ncbi:MAG: hypothetical protein HY535_02025 [Chloroflexi bacterium]|nr:hypothetical protein [Chloroflexota bacterium]
MALEGAQLPSDRFRVSIFTGASPGEVASNVNNFLQTGAKKSLVGLYLTHSSSAPVVMVLYVPLE